MSDGVKIDTSSSSSSEGKEGVDHSREFLVVGRVFYVGAGTDPTGEIFVRGRRSRGLLRECG